MISIRPKSQQNNPTITAIFLWKLISRIFCFFCVDFRALYVIILSPQLGLKVNKAIQLSLPFYKTWCLHHLMKITWRVPKFAKRLQIVVVLDQNEILWTNNPFKVWLKIWRPNVQRPMLSWKVVFPNFQVIWVWRHLGWHPKAK